MKTEDKKPNNPSAFAMGFCNEQSHFSQEGMTLRDYFANDVDIPWNVVFNFLEKEHGFGKVTFYMVAEYRAIYKYTEADAMLKQREL